MAYAQNIVVDFEFNPVRREHAADGVHEEIIEIGAVRLGPDGRELDSFSSFVRPALELRVAPAIVRLTGIRDCDVAAAPPFKEALEAFAAWAGESETRVVTWGDSDKRVLSRQCAAIGAKLPGNMRRWMDLQRVYPRLMRLASNPRRRMALRGAADWGCDGFDAGSAHRALYDARKTAELMAQLLDGSYERQRAEMRAVIIEFGESTRLASNLGARCTGLAELKRQLESA